MALTQRLEIRQGQSLVMTPQLQQAIKLLQLSNIELAEYCEQELERNPLLERDEGAAASPESPEAQNGAEQDGEALETELARDDFSKADELDAEREDVLRGRRASRRAAAAPLTDWTTLRSSASPVDGETFARAHARASADAAGSSAGAACHRRSRRRAAA